ncbi:uncharacterized protein IWZ02DRAFT_282640 [Phyllosticta citriasiana]|uniref:uncharacterized protein n=1 Tax=Phyllosticta citriasiana TaxID=595635 RepID=UPI0030FD54B9
MAWGRGGAGNIEAQEEQSKKVAEDIASQHRRASRTGSIVPIRTTVSPPPPYAHTGRGGAGNTYSPAELAQTGTFQSTATTENNDVAGASVVPAGTPASTASSSASYTTATAEPPPRDLKDLDTQTKWYNSATTSSSASPSPNPGQQHNANNANATSTSPANQPLNKTPPPSDPPVPIARTGRGGAGNFVWSSSPSSHTSSNNKASAAATASVDQAAQLQRSVLADVERGLARPGRAWLGPGPGSPPPAAATAPPATNGVGEGEGVGGAVKTSPPRKVAARKGSWVGAAVTGHGHGHGQGSAAAAPPA